MRVNARSMVKTAHNAQSVSRETPGRSSRTSLLRTPGDFADLYVVSIGRCNHGPLNQIRYTKLPKQTL